VLLEHYRSFHLDSLPPWGHALATDAHNDCKGGGDPALAIGAHDDSNRNGNSGGGPALATDAHRGNNGNIHVQREGSCGGGVSNNGGGDNGKDDDDDDEDDDNDDNNDDGSNGDDSGGGDNDDDGSDINVNSGEGGEGGGGCITAMAAGIDTVNNQLKAHDRRRPWFPCNFLVSFFAFAFCKECGLGTTQSVR